MTHTVRDDLDEVVAARTEELSELLAATVRIPSITGSERAVADWYAAWMTERGWETDTQQLAGSALAAGEETVGDRANVIGYPLGRPGAGDRVLVLNGHIDVVPPGDEATWELPPFSGERAAGRVHGRGTVDMKGGIAAALIALDTLRSADERPALMPVLHLVIGEETTGVGTRLALSDGARPAAAVILEPTGNTLVTACTGLQFFRVTARGRAAHSSAPWRGVDALARLLTLRDALVATAAERSAGFTHPRFADVPTAIPFNIGLLSAGSYRAAVPDRAELSGRIGLKPREDAASARAEYAEALRAAVADDAHEGDLPHAIEWQGAPYTGWDTADDDPLVLAFSAALAAAGGDPGLRGFTAGNDAGQYAERGAATLIFGPGDAALAHTAEESVAEADVALAARTLTRAIVSLR